MILVGIHLKLETEIKVVDTFQLACSKKNLKFNFVA